jgi:RNA polymerase primary sigma factor
MQTTTPIRPALRAVPPQKAPHELDSLAAFLSEAVRHPRLSRVEEIELAKRIEQGDEAAKRQLIASNLRRVASIAKDFRTQGVSLLDVIDDGTAGLVRAADCFDWRLGNGFSIYAGWWIQTAIRRGLESDGLYEVAA